MRLSPLTPAALITLALAGAAQAQCLPDPVANGDTVTCTGTDTNGLTTSATGIAVNVTGVVSASGNNDALQLNGLDTTVTNRGRVNGGDDGIQLGGTGGSITNGAGATITGADRGIDSNAIGSLTVDNGGFITGTASDALRSGAGLILTNRTTGVIRAGDEGVQTTANATITNDGLIDAADEGIEATDGFTLTNTGTISAVDDAVQIDDGAQITNSGTLSSAENDGIDMDSGSVINTGTIISLSGPEDGIDFDPDAANVVSTVDNRVGGVISGNVGINTDLLNDRAQAITNAGTITGTSGVALFLEDGDDSLTLLGTGIINGISDFGAGNDSFIMQGTQAAQVGGGDLFDGGAGFDTATFGISLADLLAIMGFDPLPTGLTISFANADSTISTVNLINFEAYAFTDGVFDRDQIIAAVPLPASVLLLGGALGLLAFGRRRGARV